MFILAAIIIVCLCGLYLCYLALPLGRDTLLALAAVIAALAGLVAALAQAAWV